MSARCEWSAPLAQSGRSAPSALSARWALRSSFHPNLKSYQSIPSLWNFQSIPNSRNYPRTPNFPTILNFLTIRGCPARFRPAGSLPVYCHRVDSRPVVHRLVDSDSAGHDWALRKDSACHRLRTPAPHHRG